MMAMEGWSKSEYKTFITSKRDDVFDNRESNAFSFKRPSPVEAGRVNCCEKDLQHFGADVKVQWESMMRTAMRKSPNSEFEFKSAPVTPVLTSLSKTDDIFQGSNSQLAPDHSYSSQRVDYNQHPLYRKQGVDEASKRDPTFIVSQRTVSEPFRPMSPCSLSRMYQPKYSKFCVNSTDVAPVETAMDSRSSSFRSQGSVCESGERDNGDSSTSRDSNGSSQDASSVSTDTFDRVFDAYDHHRNSTAATPTLKAKAHESIPCPADRRSVVSTTNVDCDKAVPNSSWLRSSLKWKGIFGAKKPPKSPCIIARTEHDYRGARPSSKLAEISCSGAGSRIDSAGDAKSRAASRMWNPSGCDDKNLPNKRKSFFALPTQQQAAKMDQFTSSRNSRGLKLKPSFSSDCSDAHSVLSADRERDATGIMKIRERWLKYMRMLKPPFGNKSSLKLADKIARGDSLPSSANSRSSSFQPEGPVTVEYVHTRAKSMPAIVKTPPLRPLSNPGATFLSSSTIATGGSRAIPPAGPSSARRNSFLSHSGSLVSNSPRLLKTSSPRLMSLSPKVKSSPKVSANTVSPRMSSSSVSSMSESVQGAIAHCKMSHSGLLSPAPSHHHR